MSHRAALDQLYDRINAHDADGFVALMADDFVEHEIVAGFEPSKDGVRQFFSMYFAAFPDLRFEAQDVIEQGDKLVARFRATGTHSGEFMGMPATGKAIDVEGIDIIRFGSDGVAQEHWGLFDGLTMMRQLGLAPDPAVT